LVASPHAAQTSAMIALSTLCLLLYGRGSPASFGGSAKAKHTRTTSSRQGGVCSRPRSPQPYSSRRAEATGGQQEEKQALFCSIVTDCGSPLVNPFKVCTFTLCSLGIICTAAATACCICLCHNHPQASHSAAHTGHPSEAPVPCPCTPRVLGAAGLSFRCWHQEYAASIAVCQESEGTRGPMLLPVY
jgi:hypothetical protein